MIDRIRAWLGDLITDADEQLDTDDDEDEETKSFSITRKYR